MKTKIFKIQGKFLMGEEMKPFIKELKATTKKDIYEKIYSEFGSKHHISRDQIKIEEIEEISLDQVQDFMIKAISKR